MAAAADGHTTGRRATEVEDPRSTFRLRFRSTTGVSPCRTTFSRATNRFISNSCSNNSTSNMAVRLKFSAIVCILRLRIHDFSFAANLMPGMMNTQFLGGNQPQNPMFDGFMQQHVQMQQMQQMQQQQHHFPQHQQFQQQREDQQRGASRGDRALHDRDRSRSHDRSGGDRDRRRWDSWDSHQGGGGRRDHGRSSRR